VLQQHRGDNFGAVDEDPGTAYDAHRPELEERLQEGKERFGG
jgi:hypothetical protein